MEWITLAVVILLALGWWLSWVATRVDRAHARAERTWAALDAALIRRAQKAAEVATGSDVDPATTLLVCDAAAAALDDDLSLPDREAAESGLSEAIALTQLCGVEAEVQRASLARRLHNDAVVTARALRRRPVVRLFRLAGRAVEPKPFDMAEAD